MAASMLLTAANRGDADLVPPLIRIQRPGRGGGNRPPLLNGGGFDLTDVALRLEVICHELFRAFHTNFFPNPKK